jgi:hypothetical protein
LWGVLVTISIPIFSRQLEKSRDAVSVANIRSAYAEAMNYALEYNGYPIAKKLLLMIGEMLEA